MHDLSLSGFWNSLRHRRPDEAPRRYRRDDLMKTVEAVVDGTDSRIRLVRGYRNTLQSVIGAAQDYTDRLVAEIPGAIEVSRRTFLSDPYVNAFFVDVSDLQLIFSRSSEVRDFLENCGREGVRECCALLCMQRSEKTVLGMKLSGDILRKEVPQRTVSFSDHRIYSPAPTEEETREGLRQCLFNGLVTNALERVTRLKLDSRQRRSRLRMLQSRLNHLEHRLRREKNDGLRREVEHTRQQLERLRHDHAGTGEASPQDSLQQVVAVFGRPDEFVRLRKVSLRLNKMGICIEGDSGEPCNRLELTEAIINDSPPRVITLARFPRDELLPRTAVSGPGLFS
ncbi:MAG TPA: hypothetical protein ENK05_13300 [Gammaproteobacteria bacterium]|nr:hypothetical protein [Gammaproteobacteria bacterium]